MTALGERLVVVGLGDSITAGNPGWDPDPGRRELEDPGDDPRSQYLYWAAAADRRIEFRDCGVGGEPTDNVRARLDASVLIAGAALEAHRALDDRVPGGVF